MSGKKFEISVVSIASICVVAFAIGTLVAWGAWGPRLMLPGANATEIGSRADWAAAYGTWVIGVLAGIITIATGLHAYLAEKSRQQQSVAAEDRRLSRERETFVRRVQVLMARADRGSRLSRIFLGTHAVDDSGTIDLDNWDDDESGWLELQEGVKAVLNMLGTVVWSTDDFAMVGTDAQDVMGDIELSVMQANHAAELMRLSPDRWKTQMVGFLHALTCLEKECTYLIARLAEEIERA